MTSISMEYDEEQLGWLRSKKICVACQSIFDHWYARNDWTSQRPGHYHHTIKGLRDSASTGCPVCEIMMGCFWDDVCISELIFDNYPEKAEIKINVCPTYFVINLCYYPRLDTDEDLDVLFTSIEVEVADHDHNKTVGATSKYTECPKTWLLTQKWLTLCSESHASCIEPILERKGPSRLVKVGIEDSQARLCLGIDLPENTKYLTLSHCWGKVQFTTLTSTNLETFCTGIPEIALSKTFKDAMKVTRELGFEYIWIDSLCIVQDDLLDWEQQAAIMGNIYANSSLNIAAADAVDGRDGCFFERDSRPVTSWKLSMYDDRDCQTLRVWNCCRSWWSIKERWSDVLSSRAWVCQEKCLAPRSLSFRKNEIRWECRHMEASETLIGGRINEDSIGGPALLASRWRSLKDIRITYLWFAIVVAYTSGELTFESDKLVAISGVARLFATWFNVKYVAGLWQDNLVTQLLWHTRGKTRTRPRAYRAPSWSWASTESAVGIAPLEMGNTTVDLVVVEHVFATSPGDPFSKVTGGSLSLRCQYFGKGVVFARKENDFEVMYSGRAMIRSRVSPDNNPHGLHSELLFLPMQIKTNNPLDREEYTLDGLVLERQGRESYVRLGKFRVSTSENIENFLSELSGRRVLMEDLRQGPLFESDEKGKKTEHLITIV